MRNMRNALVSLFEKSPKVFSATFFLELLGESCKGKVRSRELLQKLWKYIEMCIVPKATHLYLFIATEERVQYGSDYQR